MQSVRRLYGLLFGLALLIGCQSKSGGTEIACGGSMNFACPADMYCQLTDNCGGIDRNGICRPRPIQCKAESKPVCGCDGSTYSSPCFAAAKGVSVKADRQCAQSAEIPAAEQDEMGEEEPLLPDEEPVAETK
jgi:hypothetical protein